MRVFLAFLFTLVLLVPAQSRSPITKTFGDWSVVCGEFDDCVATSSFGAMTNGEPDFTLSIARQFYETYWEISLITLEAVPDLNSGIEFLVDETPTIFNSPDEFAAYDLLNEYYFLGSKAQSLFDLLTPGNSTSINFSDSSGAAHRAEFSLNGLTASLVWIDERQQRLGSERVAGVISSGRVLVTTREPAPVPDKLLANNKATINCDPLEDLAHGGDIMSFRISASQTLHLIPCWAGAYNFSYAAYVDGEYGIQQKFFPSYTKSLGWTGESFVVNPSFNEKTNILTAFYKGRGLGDCGASGRWKWAKWDFKLLEFRSKEDCNIEGNPGEFPVIYRAPGYEPNR